MALAKPSEATGGEGVASVYGAALARKSPRTLPMPAAAPNEDDTPLKDASTSTALILTPFTASNAPVSDWGNTLDLVERAAATIKAYERRFVQLDQHARRLAERSAEEQSRLEGELAGLEERLREAEDRAAKSEALARNEAFHRWEAERRCREAEERVGEAEAYAQSSEDYLRRVHSILSQV